MTCGEEALKLYLFVVCFNFFLVVIKQLGPNFYPTLDSLKSEVVQEHQTISLDK